MYSKEYGRKNCIGWIAQSRRFKSNFIINGTGRGFKVTRVQTLDEMMVAMGVNVTDSVLLMSNNLFSVYFMDLNLGHSCSTDYSPAQRVYNLVKPYVESGEAKFMGVSNNPITVIRAQQAGIPASFADVSPLKFLNE